MARTARVKLSGTGVADYHLMSRTNDRRFLFGKGETKTQLVAALKRAAEFCGVRIRAYTAMDNHFHIVVRVTRTDEPVPEAELVRRVGVLKGERAARELESRWAEFHAAGFEAMLAEEQSRLRAQMNDISAFIKVFKELFGGGKATLELLDEEDLNDDELEIVDDELLERLEDDDAEEELDLEFERFDTDDDCLFEEDEVLAEDDVPDEVRL